MKKILFAIFMFSCISLFARAQETMEYFLPKDVVYDKNIPTPEEFFGQKIGEWHLNYEQILSYFHEINRLSGRAIIQEYARSYENRPLVHMIFTSQENQKKLEELKNLHNSFSEVNSNLNADDVPLVVTLGYGVHGNESSATNSSVLTIYYLAAANSDKIDRLLNHTIILVDPCLNPDGFTRHSTWANMHQSYVPVGKSESRQFNEVWPGGRTNHYWFDLNRDYLLQVHPESRGRVAKFYEWKPNIVTDHHEMGANSTFFFQPGVPSRNNPLTPEKNYELTHEIAGYHAQFLDKIGSPYFSEEQYDDYYFGKGSSYPDVNGSVGILFEQAGFRGRTRNTINGKKTLAFAIRNQFTVTLSTLEAALNLKNELLRFQKECNVEAFGLAGKDAVKAYLFGDENDQMKTQLFIDLLNRHQIKVYTNQKDIIKEGVLFKANQSFVVPVKQIQYRLLKSIFGKATTFTDSTFYDVSTWTFPFAYDIPYAEITALKDIQQSSAEIYSETPEGKIVGGKSNLAYLFRWNDFYTPEALYTIQKAGLITKVATKSFTFDIEGKKENFTYGTILIPVSGQRLDENQIYSLVTRVAKKTGVDFYGMDTGLSPEGIDLGSGNFDVLKRPEVLMLVAGSTRSSDAGEIWHMFDQRFKIPICLTETGDLRSVNLSQYTTLIMPGGSYYELGNSDVQKIKSWVQDGGTLIAYKNAVSWASKNEIGKTKFKNNIENDTTLNFSYADRSKEYNIHSISGIILNTEMDITHPLCYGYTRNNLAFFKTGASVAETLDKKYTEPVKYTSEPYVSGYVSEKNIERIKNAPVVSVQSVGRGNLISFYENMTFRGFWLGTNKMFMNGVFFGDIIQ
ncbi:M14 family zinc carboxypeptidase [Maribellus maritimus]|uniref:M14 family zinc carboxypeptidase n=1 Tax=Maribellus maritimus TaxID=2870838 RepID=UPI001EEC37D4|nr:M14 family zinc carboxypeptidase [Maribellus maritimus]MCG6186052.1 zinc carboxypeptidase [Maribellus maritimus]